MRRARCAHRQDRLPCARLASRPSPPVAALHARSGRASATVLRDPLLSRDVGGRRDRRPARARLGGDLRRHDGRDQVGACAGGDARGASLAVLAVALPRRRSSPRSPVTTPADAWRFFLAGLLAPGRLPAPLHARGLARSAPSRTLGDRGRRAAVCARDRVRLPHEPVRDRRSSSAGSRSSAGGVAARRRARPARAPARPRPRSSRSGRGCLLRGARQHRARAARAREPRDRRRRDDPRRDRSSAPCAPRRLPAPRRAAPLAPAGVLFGLSYSALRGVLPRPRLGRLAARRHRDALGRRACRARPRRAARRCGRRVVLGAAAIVAGGIVIGISAAT